MYFVVRPLRAGRCRWVIIRLLLSRVRRSYSLNRETKQKKFFFRFEAKKYRSETGADIRYRVEFEHVFPSIGKILFSFLDAGFKPGDTWSALLLEEEWAEPESKVGLKRKYLWFHFSPSG